MDNSKNKIQNELKNYLKRAFKNDPSYPIERTNQVIDRYFRHKDIMKRVRSITRPPAPLVAFFCSIIHQSKIIVMDDESKTDYCKKVCDIYDVDCNIYKVRQFFNADVEIRKYKKKLKEVKTVILPLIPKKQRVKIIEFIDNNIIKMYA